MQLNHMLLFKIFILSPCTTELSLDAIPILELLIFIFFKIRSLFSPAEIDLSLTFFIFMSVSIIFEPDVSIASP